MEVLDCSIVFILFMFCSSVLCDDCVTFDFEKDFNSSFSNEIGVCGGRAMWNVGMYENLSIDSPHVRSSKFVYPNEVLSCASSFTFQMTASGILEVNLFMEPSTSTDQVTILANQIVPGGNDAVVGNAWIIARDESFISGWRTARISLTGFGSFAGYITILGMAASDSIVLVDSFRYMSPTFDEEQCNIYENIITSTKTTEMEATPPSSPYTTEKTDLTATTQTGDIESTTQELQTESIQTTQTEDPKTTESFPTITTIGTESTIVPTVDFTTETIYPITLTTPTTNMPEIELTTPISTTRPETSTEQDSTTQSEITSTIFTTTSTTNSDLTTRPEITDQTTTEESKTTITVITTQSESTITTLSPEITTILDGTTSKQSDKTDLTSTTQTGNIESTTRESRTESVQTTEIGDPTITTLVTESTIITPTDFTTETIYPITFTTPGTNIPETDKTTPKFTTGQDSTTQSEITTTIFSTTSTTKSDLATRPTEQTKPPITDDNSTEIDNTSTTERPNVNPENRFWNAYTITMVIILLIIVLIISGIIWYYIGKRSRRKDSQSTLPYFEDLPSTITIPRVSKVWTDSSTINRLSSIYKME